MIRTGMSSLLSRLRFPRRLDWAHLETYCLFVGYGRSGHSAIGSLIDAHPHAVVANEFHAVKRFFEGVPRKRLFDQIYACAQQQARDGRLGFKAGGGAYRHDIPGQLKDSHAAVRVIGSKKGAGTTWQFARRGLDRMEDFKAYIGLPVKMIHVVRNPFDMIAGARLARGESRVAELVKTVAALRHRYAGPDWLDVYLEDVIADPEPQITAILRFLGLPVVDEHLDHCRRYLFEAPRQRRLDLTWTPEERHAAAALIEGHDFLQRYSRDS